MIVSSNIQALISIKAIKNSGNLLTKSSNKLSSGYKINYSGDDPGKFALSSRMKSQIKSLEMADRNSNDAISLTQTAEGGMNEIQNMIIRMRELAVQGATETLTDEDRNKIQVEIDELVDQIDFISDTCTFNGMKLLNGSFESRTFQVGVYKDQTLSLDLLDTSSESLGLKDISYETSDNCSDAIELCDTALSTISSYRAVYGSFQNRLEYVISSVQVSNANVTNALSDIIDTDMAAEMIEYTTQNVLMQSGLSMLAQANKRPEELLSLLG